MRYAAMILALAGAVLLTGCSSLVSLDPFVTEEAAASDPNLAGLWQAGDKDLLIQCVQFEGMKPMDSEAFLRGHKTNSNRVHFIISCLSRFRITMRIKSLLNRCLLECIGR